MTNLDDLVQRLAAILAEIDRRADPFKDQSDADVIKAAYPVPLRFPPGTKWEYSNVGYFALAENGDLPRWFAFVHPRFRTPSNAILFSFAVALALSISGSFVFLAAVSAVARPPDGPREARAGRGRGAGPRA